jgi:DNA-binding FadR family transcriptional regulator
MISHGELRPGDPLPSERELMTLYGVGRPAVREAMQALERAGLVSIRHGGRARVAEPSHSLEPILDQLTDGVRHTLLNSPATLEHLKEARLLFEVQMTRLAATKSKPADIRRMRLRIDEQDAAREDAERFLEADGAFHREVAAACGNPIYPVISEAMFRWLMQFHTNAIRTSGLEDLVLSEHAAVVDLIEKGNAEKAAKAMSDHLTRASELYHRANYVVPA